MSVGVHEHLPLPMYEVGLGGFRRFDGLHVAHPGPCHLEQNGVQRLDGPHLRSGCSKRIGQRASDLTHLNVGMRHLDAAESHADRLLLGCHVFLAVNEVRRRVAVLGLHAQDIFASALRLYIRLYTRLYGSINGCGPWLIVLSAHVLEACCPRCHAVLAVTEDRR